MSTMSRIPNKEVQRPHERPGVASRFWRPLGLLVTLLAVLTVALLAMLVFAQSNAPSGSHSPDYNPQSPLRLEDLVGSWLLDEFRGQPVTEALPLRLNPGGRVSLNGGCNNGALSIDPDATFWKPVAPLASTRRYCPPGEAVPSEMAYFSLVSVRHDWWLEAGMLLLGNAQSGEVAARFRPAPD